MNVKKLFYIFLLVSSFQFYLLTTLKANTPRTASDIETQIREIINDDSSDSSNYVWTSTQILKKINLVQQEINMLAWFEQSTYNTTISSYPNVFFSTVTGSGCTYLYPRDIYLPNDLYVINRVCIENEVIEEKSTTDLDKDTTWNVPFTTGSVTSTGEPTAYYVVETSSLSKKIGFDPPPDKTYRIDIDYIKISDDMTATSTPWGGRYRLQVYSTLIIYRVASMLLAERDPNMAAFYQSLYGYILDDAAKTLGQRPNYSGGLFKVSR